MSVYICICAERGGETNTEGDKQLKLSASMQESLERDDFFCARPVLAALLPCWFALAFQPSMRHMQFLLTRGKVLSTLCIVIESVILRFMPQDGLQT